MNDDTPVYPTIRMKLSGMNPPALLAVACLSAALKGSGVEREEIDRIVDEALADGFLDNETAMRVCRKYIHVY